VFWIPIVAWAGALVVAAVILGFSAYELIWKSNRLRADLAKLQTLGVALQALQADVTATQTRAAHSAGAR
jgi:hypothetical protein